LVRGQQLPFSDPKDKRHMLSPVAQISVADDLDDVDDEWHGFAQRADCGAV